MTNFNTFFLDKNFKYGTVCVFLLLLLLVSSSGVQFPNFIWMVVGKNSGNSKETSGHHKGKHKDTIFSGLHAHADDSAHVKSNCKLAVQ